MTASQRLFEIASTLAGEDISGNYEHTFTGAFDALTDTLAGYDVERGRTISEAIKDAAPYISGGSGEDSGSKTQEDNVEFGVVVYVNSTRTEFTDELTNYIAVDVTNNSTPLDFTWEETLDGNTPLFYTSSAPVGHVLSFANALTIDEKNAEGSGYTFLITGVSLGWYSDPTVFDTNYEYEPEAVYGLRFSTPHGIIPAVNFGDSDYYPVFMIEIDKNIYPGS